MKKKLVLRKDTIRQLDSLAPVHGGIPTVTAVFVCVQTVNVCNDTEQVTNCACGPSGLCASVTCPPVTL